MAPPEHTSDKQAYYSFINPGSMKGWVGLVGWPVADGLATQWSPLGCRPSVGQGQFAGQRLAFCQLCYTTNSAHQSRQRSKCRRLLERWDNKWGGENHKTTTDVSGTYRYFQKEDLGQTSNSHTSLTAGIDNKLEAIAAKYVDVVQQNRLINRRQLQI